MSKSIFLVLALSLLSFRLGAQATGNQVYGNTSPVYQNPVVRPAETIHPSPNQYQIEAWMLYHGKADHYIAVFGVAQEGTTAVEANEQINQRIDAFLSTLRGMEIPDTSVFVDLITQTRVYGYKMTDANTAQEKLTGIELKKNVHVAFRDMAMLNNMMLAAARQDIYDIVKIDYVVKNVDDIYKQLQKAALAVIEEKKQTYMMIEEKKYAGNPLILKFEKGAVQPVNAYQSYTAHETNYLDFDQGIRSKANLVKISAHRMKTFYFDPLPEENFDKVIGSFGVEPTVQFTLRLVVRYDVL